MLFRSAQHSSDYDNEGNLIDKNKVEEDSKLENIDNNEKIDKVGE